jgi:hypothetical protein
MCSLPRYNECHHVLVVSCPCVCSRRTCFAHCLQSCPDLSTQIAHLPIAAFETLLFGSILYWMSGLAPYASNWIFFILCGFLSNLFMGALFRSFAYGLPTLQVGFTVHSIDMQPPSVFLVRTAIGHILMLIYLCMCACLT